MAGTNSEEMVKKFSEAFAAYNRHDLNAYFSMMDPDYEVHDPVAGELKGKETMIKGNEELIKTFLDLEFRDVNIAARGDMVAAECIFSGTFQGPLEFPGRAAIPPTGRRVEVRMASFWRLNSKGLISEGRNYYYDLPVFLKQLGLKTRYHLSIRKFGMRNHGAIERESQPDREFEKYSLSSKLP